MRTSHFTDSACEVPGPVWAVWVEIGLTDRMDKMVQMMVWAVWVEIGPPDRNVLEIQKC